MRDKGIKIIERLKRLAGMYAAAGEKRSVAVKALSVVLVFAVVMANLTVPKMKVKAADADPHRIMVSFDYGSHTRPNNTTDSIQLFSEYVDDDGYYVFTFEPYSELYAHIMLDNNTRVAYEFIPSGAGVDTETYVQLEDQMSIRVLQSAFSGMSETETLPVTLTLNRSYDVTLEAKDEDGNALTGVTLNPGNINVSMGYIPYTLQVAENSPYAAVTGLTSWGLQITDDVNRGRIQKTVTDSSATQAGDSIFSNGDTIYVHAKLFTTGGNVMNPISAGVKFTPVKKITVSAFYGLQTGQAALMSQSGTFSSVNYDSATNKWTIPITLAEVLPAGVNVNELKGWIVSTTTPLPTGVEIPLKSESYNNNRYIDYDTSTRTVDLTVDNDYALNPEGYVGVYLNAVVGSIDNSNSEKIAVNISYKFEHQYGEYYYAGIPYNYIYNIEIDRPSSPGTDPNFSSGEYYEFTIPESELRSIPVFKSANNSNDSTSYYAKGFTLKTADSGKMDVDQTISLGGGNQTIQIDKSFFNSQTTYDVDLYVIASSNMTKTIQKQSAGGSSKAFPLTKIEKDDNDNLYGVYNVTVPSVSEWETLYFPENYTSGIVGTNVHLDVDSVIVKDQNEATVSDKNLEQGGTYKFLVPYNSLDTTSAFYISTSPILKLPVTFNAGSDGTLTSDANKTYTSTQLNENTGEWTLSLETPGVEVSDSSKEFKGWKVPTGMPEAIGVNSVNGGYLDQNTVLTISNEYAKSVASNYSLTFTAKYIPTDVDVNVTYNAGTNGKIAGTNDSSVNYTYSFRLGNEGVDYIYDVTNSPNVSGNNGYVFAGWEKDSSGSALYSMMTMESSYTEVIGPTKDSFSIWIDTDDLIGVGNPTVNFKAAYKHSEMTLTMELGDGVSTDMSQVTIYPDAYFAGSSAAGVFKYTLSLPTLTPAAGYTFKGYTIASNNYEISDENEHTIDETTLLTGTTATIYIVENTNPSTEQINLRVIAHFDPAPKLSLSFEEGVLTTLTPSAALDASYYLYNFELPMSGAIARKWLLSSFQQSGYSLHRPSDTENALVGDDVYFLGGETVVIKGQLTTDQTISSWYPVSGWGMINGSGVVDFTNGSVFISAGKWRIDGDDYEYEVNQSVQIYSSYNSLTFTKQ